MPPPAPRGPQVWSVSDTEWHCKIDEGPVGLAHARWSPDGRHVLAAADFNLRITIWSLLDRSVYYIVNAAYFTQTPGPQAARRIDSR